jgi:spore germination protein
MKKCKLLPLILIAALLLPGCSPQKKPLTALFKKRPGVSGFYMNEQGNYNSLSSLKQHAAWLDEVYPLWYHVRADGSIEDEADPSAVKVAKDGGVKVLPLINVIPSNDAVLNDPTATTRAIDNILALVKQNDYDGVNIDFEFIPNSEQQDFSMDRGKLDDFMRRLSEGLKKMGKVTHMCVLPHVGVSPELAGVYDYSGLAPYVDKVTIMCYDHSQAGSPPGPVAPFSWVEDNIKTAIKQGFKSSQICLGVATYGYDWPAGQSGGFSAPTKEIMQKAAMKGIQIKWSDQYEEPYYVYTGEGGEQRVVWFENESTLQTKINLVRKYNLTGVCIWRLGFEDAKFWQVINKNFGKR